jgi:hypothetical protein
MDNQQQNNQNNQYNGGSNNGYAGAQPVPPANPNMPQPAGYDIQGRPLYYAPPMAGAGGPNPASYPPQQSGAPSNHQSQDISPEVQQRSEESRRRYPQLNMSEGEYMVMEVKRHPFGIFQIWLIAITLIAAFGALVYGYASSQSNTVVAFSNAVPIAMVGLVLIAIFVVIGAVVASYVYNNNRFFVTNESVIQEIQQSLFGKHEQTVNLGRIEDASYFQDGFLPTAMNFGRIRLSTVGDESTYQFNYVIDPKKVIAELNNEIERYKHLHS